MIEMRKCILMCFLLVTFLTACGKEHSFESETLYFYSGEMLSLVDQRENEYSKDKGILYTLTLTDFRPKEPVFQKFIESYQSVTGKEGHISFTERTKIYARSQTTNTKTSIPVSDLYQVLKPTGSGDYPKIEIWVTPYKKGESDVEAVEVVLLQ
ncbi:MULTISPECIES: hypothetical protein [Paenibacillus]|uniref:Lipoprotein n=1 Tax=Paenibacillus prosopidis TaxID=630520 RepID=A0A368VGU7_9BACL|nr:MULTISPECIES: hypothetical protein [Paenibacillus]KRE33498.1 hypothetical protein ASG81_23410 [Paenibacillus sp. Soil522]RCW40330.1 hypothetical protein DFP97_1367 [Paenibacillus prosopidis]